jgi:hypothetical protein
MVGERTAPGKPYSQATDRPMGFPMPERDAGRPRRGATSGRRLVFACAVALALPFAAARAEEPAAPDPSSPIADGPEPDATPERPAYQPVGPGERRGRTTDLEEVESTPGLPQPATGGGDPGDFPGETRTLEEMSRSPGPTRKKADWEKEDVPGPLKLRRLPGDGPPPDAPLLVRLCDADAARTFAQRELKDAVRAYKRARRGDYPHGEAKWLVVERRDIAVRRAARADAEVAALREEAETARVDYDAAECP